MTLVAATNDDVACEEPIALEVIVARDAGALAALQREWDALAETMPFRTYRWAMTWWRHYRQTNREQFVALVVDAAGDLVGVAPWCLKTLAREGHNPPFLGSGEACSGYDGYNFPGDGPFHLQRIHVDDDLVRSQNWTTLDPRKLIAAWRCTYTPTVPAEPEVVVPLGALV